MWWLLLLVGAWLPAPMTSLPSPRDRRINSKRMLFEEVIEPNQRVRVSDRRGLYFVLRKNVKHQIQNYVVLKWNNIGKLTSKSQQLTTAYKPFKILLKCTYPPIRYVRFCTVLHTFCIIIVQT